MPLYVTIAASVVALSVVTLCWALLGIPGTRSNSVRSNLRTGIGPNTDLRQAELARSAGDRLGRPVVTGLASLAMRLTPGGLLAGLERRITLAGVGRSWPLERVLAAKVVGAFAASWLAIFRLFSAGVTTGGVLLSVLVVGVGFWLPEIVLHFRAKDRQERIRLELPDVLDELTVTVEAGVGFEAALGRVIDSGHGPLHQELGRYMQDVQLGVSRDGAMRGLLERTDVDDLRHFVLAMSQAEKLGVPIATVLRVQAGELREKRRQRAEERAMKIPVKIIMPVVVCIFPALMIVLIGPAGISIYENLLGVG